MLKWQIANIHSMVEIKPSKRRKIANLTVMIEHSIPVRVTYDRQAAAQRAINLSKDNFRAFASGGFPENYTDVSAVIGKIERSINARDYSDILTHTPGATGSAIFISECIYAGGIPMTVRPDTNPNNPMCDDTDFLIYGGYTSNGWRICPSEQSATNTWRNHQGIIQYFTTPVTGLGGEQLLPSITLDDIVNVVYQTPEVGIGGNLKEGQPGYEEAKTALINKLNSPTLNGLKAGDYIYTANSSGGDNHGFFVVGWGPLRGTQDGIEYALTSSLSISRAALHPEHVIPYVADFNFGTKTNPDPENLDSNNPDDRTGWLQDPRARPFYSTHVRMTTNLRNDQIDYLKRRHYPTTLQDPVIPIYDWFNFLQWDFYKIPDSATIPWNRVFYP